MSSTKDIRRVSEQWLEMFDWFEAHPEEPLSLTVETEKRARGVRVEFYHVRKLAQQEEEFRKMYPQVDRREVTVKGTVVTFRYRETTPIAILLSEGLQKANEQLEQKAQTTK